MDIPQLVVPEELQGKRCDDVVAEAHTQKEQDGGTEANAAGRLPFALLERGTHKQPALPKDQGEGRNESSNGRHQDVGGKVAQHGGVDQLVVDAVNAQRLTRSDPFRELAPRTKGDEIHVTRPEEHHIEQPVFGQKQANATSDDKKRRVEEPLAQFFQVVQETHFDILGGLVVRLVQRHGAKLALNDAFFDEVVQVDHPRIRAVFGHDDLRNRMLLKDVQCVHSKVLRFQRFRRR